VIILGGEGKGASVAACVREMRLVHGIMDLEITGFLNDYLFGHRKEIDGWPVLGKISDVPGFKKEGFHFFYAINPLGFGRLRTSLFSDTGIGDEDLVSVIHPSAQIALSATIGPGSYVMCNAYIGPRTRIGKCGYIGANSCISHDCQIGDLFRFSNGALMASYVHVGNGVDICLGATIVDQIRIGDFSVIGANSLVTRDVGESDLYFGSPARFVRKIDPDKPYRLNESEGAYLA